MQTKPKQKLTAILIALTMILTTMMQLCIPITVHAEEQRELTLSCSLTFNDNTNNPIINDYEYTILGNGNFVVISYRTSDEYDGMVGIAKIILSNTSFQTLRTGSTTYNNSTLYNGVYYSNIGGSFASSGCYIESNSGFPNTRIIDLEYGSNWTKQLRNDIDNGLIDLSKDDYEEKSFDDVATYDESIPTPKFKVEKNLRFDFLNSESDYYYEVKGRWYTTDDFYLHLGGFMNAIWLYDYETIYKNDLTDWITYKDKRNTAITGYLKDIGENSFSDLIKKYPIGTRQITGEKNKDGSYKAGFDHASSNLVMWLKDSTSIYNGIEVYIRYYKIDENGNYTYGKWAHYYNSLAKQSGAEINDNVLNDVEHNYSDKGLTNDELNDLENSGQSKGDTDIVTDYGDNGGGILSEIDKLDEVDFSNVIKVILSLFQQTKAVFNMFTTVLSFMPIWVTELIGVSVVIICLIGIWKALR